MSSSYIEVANENNQGFMVYKIQPKKIDEGRVMKSNFNTYQSNKDFKNIKAVDEEHND